MLVILKAFLQTASHAIAQTAATGQKPSLLEQFFPIILFVFVAYFIFIRPQGKKAKAHQDFLVNLKRGDSVLTSGGIWGRIEGITDKFVTLDVGEGVRLKVLKANVTGSVEEKNA
jgi:preprotein translocase subunit YajC